MPACDGNCRTADFSSPRCSTSNAGGNRQSAQKPTPWVRPPQRPGPIGRWCARPAPGLDPLRSPSNPRVKHGAGSGSAATPRAPLTLPGRRRPIHPPPYRSLVQAPLLQQPSHLLHSQLQPPACHSTAYCSNCSQFYLQMMRVSPWFRFRSRPRDAVCLGRPSQFSHGSPGAGGSHRRQLA